MELILLVAFLVYPVYQLRQLSYRPVETDSGDALRGCDDHYRRTEVFEDRC